ncbi:MAG: InlB B-repeat-containing protein, partial [Lachnospiraceae bacterium]|nr:InlB B-repeat-containing protein [Lachnospiraceae bacterium]
MDVKKLKNNKILKSVLSLGLILVMIVTIAPSGVSIITKNKRLSKINKVEAAGIPTAPSVSAPTEPNWTTFTSNATDFAQLQDDLDSQATPGSSVRIIVANDITDGINQINGNHVLKIPDNSKVYLTGGDKQVTLDFAANGQTSRGGITVSGNATLYLSNIKLTGGNRTDNNGPGGGIIIGSGLDDKTDASTVVMKDGTEITGNTSGIGGGVYVSDNSKLYMLGGVISNNTTTSRGAGVYLHNGGQLFMKNGTISGNTANGGYGGGVAVDTDGSTDRNSYFLMENGIISDNVSNAHDGAGVAVAPGTTFDFVDGSISTNRSIETKGGGVWVSDATFNMWSGEISSNHAWYGGGVQVETSDTSGYSYDNAAKSVFNMYGGTIGGEGSGNTGANPGVLLGAPTENGFGRNGGTFNMYGGTISYNENVKDIKTGGGISIYNYGVANITGTSEISYNYYDTTVGGAGMYGGGIGVQNYGKFNISGNTKIENNTASNGGGIYASHGGDSTISGNVVIQNNKATNGDGGGITIDNTKLTISDNVKINTNTASSGGGAIEVYYSNLIMNDSDTTDGTNEIIGNKSTAGSGLSIYGSTATATIENTTISENTSTGGEYSGGAVVVAGSNVTLTNTVVSKNYAMSRGGAIYGNSSAVITLNKVEVKENTSLWGALLLDHATGVINNSTFEENTSAYVGAIRNQWSNCTIDNSSFIKNISQNIDGGAILHTAGTLTISDSEFIENQAKGHGGAVASEIDTNNGSGGADTSITNTKFSKNIAQGSTGFGGGLYLSSGKTDIESSTFDGNSGYKGGGIYTSSGSEVHFKGSNQITNNVATTDGGGIFDDYWTTSGGNFENLYFEDSSKTSFSGNIADKTNLTGDLPTIGEYDGDILSVSIDRNAIPSGVVKDQIDDFAQNNDVKKLIVFNNNDINMTSSTHYYTVKFDSNGGSDVPYQLVSDDGSSTVTKPADPTKDEYTFAGW